MNATDRRYLARMQKVLDHIDAHLQEDLGLERLAAVAAFSRFHFQRQFTALFGLGVGKYVQLLRMKRASHRLAFRDAAVTDVALEAGYESLEAFSRAFKGAFGQAPSAFRKEPRWELWHAANRPMKFARSLQMQSAFVPDRVDILHFPATRVLCMEHRGAPERIGDTLRRFIAWRKAAGLPPATHATFNVFHSEAEPDSPGDFHVDICVAADRLPSDTEAGVRTAEIPAGRCAVLRVTGPGDDLRAAAGYLYGEWLPRSGEEARDFPLFCRRVAFFPDVAEHEGVTDVYLPLV